MLVTNNVQFLHCNGVHKVWTTIRASTGLLKGSVHVQLLQPNGPHACYSSDVPFYNRFFTDTLYQGEQCTVIATAGGHTKYWNKLNITCIDIAFCFLFRVFMLILSVKFVDMIKLHRRLFYILGIICIKHIFSYLYFSHNAFPKIW